MFEYDQEIGINIMHKLLPDSQNFDEIILLILMHKMVYTGKSFRKIFELINRQQEKHLNISEIIEGMEEIGLQMNQQEVQILKSFLEENNVTQMTSEQFCYKVEQFFKKYANKEKFMCSKAQFLLAISDEYEDKRLRNYRALKEHFIKFDTAQQGILDQGEIEDLCKSIDYDFPFSKISSLFAEAQQFMNIDNEKIDADAFA